SSAASDVYKRQVQAEEGTVPTSRSPAVEDSVSIGDFTKKTNEIVQTVDSNTQKITSVESKVNTLNTDVTEVVKKTNEIKQTVDSNTATISSLNQSVGSLSSQTNSIQQTVAKSTAEIGSIGKTQGTQAQQIQTNTSKITQLSNEISSSVTDTEMRDYIGNIGKVNMISNSAFEERTIHPTTGIVTSTKPSISKWEARGTNANATVMAVNASHHAGYNSVKIECSGLTDANFTNISQSMPIVDGSGAYIFSVWIYRD
ncbi:DUF948 domain-containing protein, partial [Bacillus cereus]|uniref:DUF948 domain-containing protein n=1 Tax=Bacillus cereus TaxID=1396 RepID=UPI001A20A850